MIFYLGRFYIQCIIFNSILLFSYIFISFHFNIIIISSSNSSSIKESKNLSLIVLINGIELIRETCVSVKVL